MNNLKFTDNLLKGKIAEIIFEQMLRSIQSRKEDGGLENVFTVLHFGYEHILPELAKNKDIKKHASTTLDAIRTAPDFAIVNNKTKEVSLVEVKYRKKLNKDDILNTAKHMEKSWVAAKLFIATPDGFYFDDIKDIIENKGEIQKFSHPDISIDVQMKYLELLNKYEQ